MNIVYAKIHDNEAIHNYINNLGAPEIVFPKDLKSLLCINKGYFYSVKLKEYYATLGDVLIIEPHSSFTELNKDYFIYYSGIDESVFLGFKKIVGENGEITKFDEEFKRILFEFIIKPNDNIKEKLGLCSKGILYVVNTLKDI